jgi:hypothetical protein
MRSDPGPDSFCQLAISKALRAADERRVMRPARGVPEERFLDAHQRFLL